MMAERMKKSNVRNKRTPLIVLMSVMVFKREKRKMKKLRRRRKTKKKKQQNVREIKITTTQKASAKEKENSRKKKKENKGPIGPFLMIKIFDYGRRRKKGPPTARHLRYVYTHISILAVSVLYSHQLRYSYIAPFLLNIIP